MPAGRCHGMAGPLMSAFAHVSVVDSNCRLSASSANALTPAAILWLMDSQNRMDLCDKVRIARGWRSSGLTQQNYAALHSMSPRTLRSWLQQFAPELPAEAVEQVREVIRDAITRLEVIARSLDAALANQEAQEQPAAVLPPNLPDGNQSATPAQTPKSTPPRSLMVELAKSERELSDGANPKKKMFFDLDG